MLFFTEDLTRFGRHRLGWGFEQSAKWGHGDENRQKASRRSEHEWREVEWVGAFGSARTKCDVEKLSLDSRRLDVYVRV